MSNKILFIHIFQPFAQFRNPFTIQYAQTFLLPPPSTLIGMLQNMTGRYYDEEFRKLRFSIHGASAAVFWNYQRLISTSSISFGLYNGRPVPIVREKDMGFDYAPIYFSPPAFRPNAFPTPQQELFNNNFFIFVTGPTSLLEEIISNLNDLPKTLYLGRSEDVAFFRNFGIIAGEDYEPLSGSLDSDNVEIRFREAKRSVYYGIPTYLDKSKIKSLVPEDIPAQEFYLPLFSTFCRNNGNKIEPIRGREELIFDEVTRNTDFGVVKYIPENYHLRLKPEARARYLGIRINFSRNLRILLKILEKGGWLGAE